MTCLSNCWWQILLAAVAYFAVGAVWFNPKVMGSMWQKSHNLSFTEEQMKKGMAPTMVVTFLCTLVLSFVICYMRCHTAASCAMPGVTGTACCSLWHSVKIGLLLGGGTAGASMSMAYVYQMKPRNAYITDIGYHVIGSVVAALVLHFTC
jgi:hypothetical protein